MVQFREKMWFQKIGEEGIYQLIQKRRIQGIFVGHQDRTRAILYIAKSGGVRGRSWIRQTSSNAWTPMNLDVMITETKLASRRQMMKPEMKLTKKVTADEEGTGF